MSASMHSVDTHDDTDTVPGLVVFRYEAPLFFINAPDFFDEAMDVVDPETDVLLINMEASANLDVTSLDTLAELNDTLRQRGVDMWLARFVMTSWNSWRSSTACWRTSAGSTSTRR